MIKVKLTKAIASSLIAVSVLALSPIGASASYAKYDTNNNILYNYQFSYDQCLDGQGNKVTNKWIRDWSYDDKSNSLLRDAWYYFDANGFMAVGWRNINGKWYYFQEVNDSDGRGIMLHDTTTPDGYYLGSDGAWINSVSKTYKYSYDNCLEIAKVFFSNSHMSGYKFTTKSNGSLNSSNEYYFEFYNASNQIVDWCYVNANTGAVRN